MEQEDNVVLISRRMFGIFMDHLPLKYYPGTRLDFIYNTSIHGIYDLFFDNLENGIYMGRIWK